MTTTGRAGGEPEVVRKEPLCTQNSNPIRAAVHSTSAPGR